MDIVKQIAQELQVEESRVQAALRLLDEGCTVPFIARYRKEATGSLDDVQLRTLASRLEYLRSLQERREAILKAVGEQGALNAQLKRKIEEADTLVQLEDLYLPYRPKRRTRASAAREKGLEPLAELLLLQKSVLTPLEEARAWLKRSEDVQAENEEAALSGARDILAERVCEDAAVRSKVRRLFQREGVLRSKARKEGMESVYEQYYDYQETVRTLPGYRILAMDRGEREKVLTVSIEVPEEKALSCLYAYLVKDPSGSFAGTLREAAQDGYRRLLAPVIEREVRAELTAGACEGAIAVFGRNLRQLLMTPPIPGKVVLGWDPAFRTGCKLAVVDPTGKVLDTAVIYPTAPTTPAKKEAAAQVLRSLIAKHKVELISVGNGTASRESQQFLADFLKTIGEKVTFAVVNEAGASVYSASALAAEEFPEYDVGARSAISIARRLQDPLPELVKIDPKAIGVGQYQHDMNQKKLEEALGAVVEDCVNAVGVDLNTASVPLLSYISGISRKVAEHIVAWREENGRFASRSQLKKVPLLGPKTFEQCAGFLRVKDGEEPLDATGVHPESYAGASALLRELGYTFADIRNGTAAGIGSRAGRGAQLERLAERCGVGVPTLEDMIRELEKPGRDPRQTAAGPVLRSDVMDISDLRPGMVLQGEVRNVIDFGAFVDIGVHQDGMIHISQLCGKRFVKHPLEVVNVGDIVKVKVLSVDEKKGRIGLSMKELEEDADR